MKKKIFMVMIPIILFIILLYGILIIKPKYELNKSIKLLKEANYKEAYTYISNTENENNIKIIKELISMKLLDYMSGGLEQITDIATQGTEIITNANKDRSNIDYSLDDTLNIYVKKLDDYVEIKNKISKEMIITELSESYDLYFEVLQFVNINFVDILNYIEDENFANQIYELVPNLYTIAVDITSVEHNYDFSEQTNEIYKEMDI